MEGDPVMARNAAPFQDYFSICWRQSQMKIRIELFLHRKLDKYPHYSVLMCLSRAYVSNNVREDKKAQV